MARTLEQVLKDSLNKSLQTMSPFHSFVIAAAIEDPEMLLRVLKDSASPEHLEIAERFCKKGVSRQDES